MKMDNFSSNSGTARAAGWMQQQSEVESTASALGDGIVGKTNRRKADGKAGEELAKAGFQTALSGAVDPARLAAAASVPGTLPTDGKAVVKQAEAATAKAGAIGADQATKAPVSAAASAMSPMEAMKGRTMATVNAVASIAPGAAQASVQQVQEPVQQQQQQQPLQQPLQQQSNHAIQSTVDQSLKGMQQEAGSPTATRPAQALQAAAVLAPEVSKTAEMSPATSRAASSLNTGSAIAGLKPWSKEWVFTGMEEATPDLQTLFGKKNDAGIDGAARDLIAQLQAGGRHVRAEAVVEQKSGGPAQAATVARPARASALEETSGSKSAPTAASSHVSAPSVMGGDTTGLEGLLQAGAAAGIPAALLREALESEVRSEDDDSVDGRAGEALPKRLGSEIAGQSAARSVGGAEYLEMLQGVRNSGVNAQQSVERQPVAGHPSARGSGRMAVAGEAKNAAQAEAVLPGELRSKQGTAPRGTHAVAKDGADEFVRQFEAQRAGIQAAGAGNLSEIRKPAPTMLSAQVTQGSKLRDRLSSDALVGLSSGIRNLGPQGGEIRMKLKPEGIGEVHLRVVTHGNDVGLKIQASNESAKRILEESMGFLKDSLAANQLQLVRTEISVGTALASSHDGSSQGQQQQSQQQFQSQPDWTSGMGQQAGGFGAAFGQQGQSGGSRQGLWSGDADEVGVSRGVSGGGRRTVSSIGLASASAARSSGDSSRLDVMA